MKKKTILMSMKSYIQPFEKVLALRELSTLSGAEPVALNDCADDFSVKYVIETKQLPKTLAKNLSYWEFIEGKQKKYTRQVIRESTVNVTRNGISIDALKKLLPYKIEPPLPNRRCLRYGTHGMHEYRGKFFPQLVRALINMSDVRKSSGIVADTMCGSGTTLVEASLAGHIGIGLDMNPLSVFITKTKCDLMRIPANEIIDNYYAIRDSLININGTFQVETFDVYPNLKGKDIEYLNKWFSKEAMTDLNKIMAEIKKIKNSIIKDFMTVLLSNILRKVSWQKTDDLRVRREIRTDIEIDPIKEFLEELGRSVRTVIAFLLQENSGRYGKTYMFHGDSRNPAQLLNKWSGKVDVVITSPPYATALPYIDTDRLSLIYLKLLSKNRHRALEQEMVGNREITEKSRKLYWEMYLSNKKSLPNSVTNLIQEVHERNINAAVGFRRKNLAALLAKYFVDMKSTFSAICTLLKKNSPAHVVIGNNHTYAGGKKIVINTEVLLADIAQQVGFKLADRIPMDMLVSRDIFKKNAIRSETIICLKKNQ